jgi:hypothetical protein
MLLIRSVGLPAKAGRDIIVQAYSAHAVKKPNAAGGNMQVVWNVLIVLVIALGPRLMVSLSKRVKVAGFTRAVFLCYAGGFFTEPCSARTLVAMDISEILIPIAIPLILFSASHQYKKVAKPMLNSFLLVCAAVVGVAVASYLLYRNLLPEAYKYAGMIVGLHGRHAEPHGHWSRAVGERFYIVWPTLRMLWSAVYTPAAHLNYAKLARKFLKPFDAGVRRQRRRMQTYTEHWEKNFVRKKNRFRSSRCCGVWPLCSSACSRWRSRQGCRC